MEILGPSLDPTREVRGKHLGNNWVINGKEALKKMRK